MLLHVARKQHEGRAETDSTPWLCHLHDGYWPRECLNGVLKRIDDEAQDKLDDLTVEQQVDLFEVFDERARLQHCECQGEAARVEAATPDIPDLTKPGAKSPVRASGKRSRSFAKSIR